MACHGPAVCPSIEGLEFPRAGTRAAEQPDLTALQKLRRRGHAPLQRLQPNLCFGPASPRRSRSARWAWLASKAWPKVGDGLRVVRRSLRGASTRTARANGPHLHRQDRSLLHQIRADSFPAAAELWRAVLPALFRCPLAHGNLSPSNLDCGPRWREYREPPGPNVGRRDVVVCCKAAGQGWQHRGDCFPEKFRHSGSQAQNTGF